VKNQKAIKQEQFGEMSPLGACIETMKSSMPVWGTGKLAVCIDGIIYILKKLSKTTAKINPTNPY
jgi:hypothetical protein